MKPVFNLPYIITASIVVVIFISSCARFEDDQNPNLDKYVFGLMSEKPLGTYNREDTLVTARLLAAVENIGNFEFENTTDIEARLSGYEDFSDQYFFALNEDRPGVTDTIVSRLKEVTIKKHQFSLDRLTWATIYRLENPGTETEVEDFEQGHLFSHLKIYSPEYANRDVNFSHVFESMRPQLERLRFAKVSYYFNRELDPISFRVLTENLDRKIIPRGGESAYRASN